MKIGFRFERFLVIGRRRVHGEIFYFDLMFQNKAWVLDINIKFNQRLIRKVCIKNSLKVEKVLV